MPKANFAKLPYSKGMSMLLYASECQALTTGRMRGMKTTENRFPHSVA